MSLSNNPFQYTDRTFTAAFNSINSDQELIDTPDCCVGCKVLKIQDYRIPLRRIAKFFVPCNPVGQPRQRFALKGKGDRVYVQNYTPKKHPVNTVKQTVFWLAKAEKIEVIKGPVALALTFFLPRPKRLVGDEFLPHDGKPDLDNLEKPVMDALKTAEVYLDDKQVFSLCSGKYFTPPGKKNGIDIEIFNVMGETKSETNLYP
jgi:Holliday junction resolvase RusA-like endonuclease